LEGRISKLPLDKESKLKEGLGGVPRRERSILCFGGKKKEDNESVRRRLVFMCGKVLFKKNMCANKSMEGSCV
jgi:hypothetical protein